MPSLPLTLHKLRLLHVFQTLKSPEMKLIPTAAATYVVTVHPFPSPTRWSCAYERGDPSAQNAFVYIGGLTGGPQAIDLEALAEALNKSGNISYSLWEFRMRSSYTGFGYSSLANDVADTSAMVQYLRGLGKEKIVLMGHSTGAYSLLK
jgi:pimeloyl-ACP methyl ester carboxylesterase